MAHGGAHVTCRNVLNRADVHAEGNVHVIENALVNESDGALERLLARLKQNLERAALNLVGEFGRSREQHGAVAVMSASMDALDALFNTEKSYSMASDIKRVADIAQRAKAEASKPVNQEPVKATTMNFTQNNYSPKALSKLDIYRQTKNQFAQMKGALG